MDKLKLIILRIAAGMLSVFLAIGIAVELVGRFVPKRDFIYEYLDVLLYVILGLIISFIVAVKVIRRLNTKQLSYYLGSFFLIFASFGIYVYVNIDKRAYESPLIGASPESTALDIYNLIAQPYEYKKIYAYPKIITGKENVYLMIGGILDDCAKVKDFSGRLQGSFTYKATSSRSENDNKIISITTFLGESSGVKLGGGIAEYKNDEYSHSVLLPLDVFPEELDEDGWIDSSMKGRSQKEGTINIINLLSEFKNKNSYPYMFSTTSPYCPNCPPSIKAHKYPHAWALWFNESNKCGSKFKDVTLEEIKEIYDKKKGYSTKIISEEQVDLYYKENLIGFASLNNSDLMVWMFFRI